MEKVQSGVKSVQLRKTGNLFCFVLLEFEKLPANLSNILLAKDKGIQNGNSLIYYRSHRDKKWQDTNKNEEIEYNRNTV